MKSKLDKRSYLIGIFMGVMIGIGCGYMIAIFQGLHQLGADQASEVSLSIAALRKLEKNDTESASKLLRLVHRS